MQELSTIKKLRKKHGLTQIQLAQMANVSQSLIAKVESKRLDPSYTNAKKIFETLQSLEENQSHTAKDMMMKKIHFAQSTDSLKTTIVFMRKHNISQLPVLNEDKVVGYISEGLLLDKILEGDHSREVGEIMDQPPPIVPPQTSQSIIANLLKHFPFVLVEDKGKLKGIVTKADLLKIVYD